MAPNTKDDALSRSSSVNNAVAGGYQAIIVAANGPDAISSALKEAAEAGVKIVYVDSPANVRGGSHLLHRQHRPPARPRARTMLDALGAAGVTSGKIGIVNVNAATDFHGCSAKQASANAFEGTDFEHARDPVRRG